METKYPTLKRPKRKLCYNTIKDSQPKQWTGKVTLDDVDKMFDDLDSVKCEDDILPPSPELHINVPKIKQLQAAISPIPQVPDGAHLRPSKSVVSAGPDLDVDLDFPFKVHGAVKTSSPIEASGVDVNKEQNKFVSPILFDCEEDGKEAQPDALPVQDTQQNGHISDDDFFVVECLPSKCSLTKKCHTNKNKVDTQRKENTTPSVSLKRCKSTVAAPKKPETVRKQQRVEVPTRVKKNMNTFLQKFRDAGQAQSARARVSSSQFKTPSPPPEPEDDFIILEDDAPLLFSIPRKVATNKRQGENKTSNPNIDRKTEGNSEETTKKQQESQQAKSKPTSLTVDKKIKKKRGKETGISVTESDNDSEEDIVASVKADVMDPDKPNRKTPQQKKEATSKDNDTAEDEPSREMDDGRPSGKTEMKAQNSVEKKRSKSSNVSEEFAKTNKATSTKKIRKRTEGLEAVNEAVEEQNGEEHVDTQEHIPPSDISVAEEEEANILPNGISNENKLPSTEEACSSENCHIPNKRKRKPTGQWWLSCSPKTEETPVSGNQQPTIRKTKQSNKETTVAVASPVKSSHGGGRRMSNQKQPPATSSQEQRQKTTEKKGRHIKKKLTRRGRPDKRKATHKEANEVLEEPIQDQESDVPDEDLNEVQSTSTGHRGWDRSVESGHKVFKSINQPVSDERLPTTPACASYLEQLEETEAKLVKRKRRSPGNWWQVNATPEDVESSTSEPQQLKPKETTLQKERKSQWKKKSEAPTSPKNRPATVSSRPPGGARVPPVEQQASRCTLAPFSSAAQTASTINRGNVGQNKKGNPTAHPAEDSAQVLLTDGDVDYMDSGESRGTPDRPPSHESSKENMCKSFRSGLCSIIPLQQHEEDEDSMLPSSRVTPAVLCTSDLCAPPLKPLILQPNDKATLAEWLTTVWSPTMDNSASEITPDHFDWYLYQGRAIGFMMDVQSGSICTGKILLGSFMKKPLWVDHSATTVFNVLTSSVNVTVDCSESRYSPGQSFLVPCGHAYSLQNLSAQPAVLYFTRVLAEDV